MRNQSKISKWGNSLAVRIPLGVARHAGLADGDTVTLASEPDGAIVLRSTRRKYELAELVSRITPKNRHKETDWGRPPG